MESLPEITQPACYEFRVRGQLGPQSTLWFDGMDIVVDETVAPVQTTIRGLIVDQAALHGAIKRIRDLGLFLISVNFVERKKEGDEGII